MNPLNLATRECYDGDGYWEGNTRDNGQCRNRQQASQGAMVLDGDTRRWLLASRMRWVVVTATVA
jgi:hypothetical protein